MRALVTGAGGLDETGLVQGVLFDQDRRKKQAGLDAVADQIRERYGSSALSRAASFPHRSEPRPGARPSENRD